MKKYFVLAYCFVCALLVSCQQEENGVVVTDSSSEEVCEIGFYHNEILKNFIEIRQQPHSRAISDKAEEFKQLMADYGVAVRQAYKNDPPSSNLDQWVGEVLRVSLTAKQINIVNSIIYDNMTCGEAIYSEYKNAMPQVVEDYMAEIGEIIERYGGTTACENKLTLLHVQYYKAAESEYKQLITWIGNVAEGSYDYWNEDYKNWNPRLSGRFWDETLRIGTPIVLADMSGVAEYFFKYRWGMILGPISWKVGAAYAAASSIFAGATTLINEINSRNGGLSYYIEDVSFHEIYEIYLQRKEELGI